MISLSALLLERRSIVNHEKRKVTSKVETLNEIKPLSYEIEKILSYKECKGNNWSYLQ